MKRIISSLVIMIFSCSLLCGKGYHEQRLEDYMVEIGGEISLHGTNPKGETWSVGINVPEEDSLQRINGIQNVLKITDGGVATSGNYRNFYYKNGKRYAHTIDPRTGYPVQQDILSSTVVAPDCMTADAFATAFMVLGSKKAMEVLANNKSIKAYFIIADESEPSGYKVLYSDSLKQMIASNQ